MLLLSHFLLSLLFFVETRMKKSSSYFSLGDRNDDVLFLVDITSTRSFSSDRFMKFELRSVLIARRVCDVCVCERWSERWSER